MVLVLLAGFGMLAAASVAQAAIPSMLGTWQGNFNLVQFENVLVEEVAPVYADTTDTMKITSQKGRLFAGPMRNGEHEQKVTGLLTLKRVGG